MEEEEEDDVNRRDGIESVGHGFVLPPSRSNGYAR